MICELKISFIVISLNIFLCGCDHTALQPEVIEYPIIITSGETSIEELDQLFAEFVKQYGFTRTVMRHAVLGTLIGFDEFEEPIPLEPTRTEWTEADMLTATRQFVYQWHKLLGLDTTSVADVIIFQNGTTADGAGWFLVQFEQQIDSYLKAPGHRLQCGVSDNGFLWNLSSGIIPNVRLPRVSTPIPEEKMEEARQILLGKTLTPYGHCGELLVTSETIIQFKETRLLITQDDSKIEVRIIYSLTARSPNDDFGWLAFFDAISEEFLQSRYDFGCF